MPKGYLSNRQKNLKVGISSYTENQTVLEVTGGSNISGNVGIGTTNPTSKLTIGGDAFVSGVVSATAFYGNGQNLTDIIASKLAGISLYDEGNLIGTALSYTSLNFVGDYVTTTGVGSTGVITFTTPSYALNSGISTSVIGGIASVTQLNVSGVSTFQNNVSVSGTIGIGTTSPTSKLDVIGDVKVSGIITSSSFSGSGSNLTGIVTSIVAGTGVTISGSTGQVIINASGTDPYINVDGGSPSSVYGGISNSINAGGV